jgi:hypothetical protein
MATKPPKDCSSESEFYGKRPTETRRKADSMPPPPRIRAPYRGQRPDIGTLAAISLKLGMVASGTETIRRRWDFDRAACQFTVSSVPGEVIGLAAFDLDGGEARRHLRDGPV